MERAECDRCNFWKNSAPGPCRRIGCGGTVAIVEYVSADQLVGAVAAMNRAYTALSQIGPCEVAANAAAAILAHALTDARPMRDLTLTGGRRRRGWFRRLLGWFQ